MNRVGVIFPDSERNLAIGICFRDNRGVEKWRFKDAKNDHHN